MVEDVGVAVVVMEPVGVPVVVDVRVVEPDAVTVAVDDEVNVGGNADGLTETASCPTTILTPQTSGRVRVAE